MNYSYEEEGISNYAWGGEGAQNRLNLILIDTKKKKKKQTRCPIFSAYNLQNYNEFWKSIKISFQVRSQFEFLGWALEGLSRSEKQGFEHF